VRFARVPAAMAMTLWLTLGLSVWIVVWAIGANPFDAFMLTILIVVIGAALHIVRPYLPGASNRWSQRP
jgi:hypothetical protein